LKEKLKLKDTKGALVADVTEGAPAEKAGIERGDVIVSFDGKEIVEMKDLPYLVASTPVGKTVPVVIIRKGRKKTVQVKIGELKEVKKPLQVGDTKLELGMGVEEITPELARDFDLQVTEGLVVVHVVPGSPAAEAGIKPGDVILELDQSPVRDMKTFHRKIKTYKEGDTVLFLIRRQSSTLYLTLKIED
jgi:serine protease Do